MVSADPDKHSDEPPNLRLAKGCGRCGDWPGASGRRSSSRWLHFVASTVFLYAAPLVPKAVFDLVLDPVEQPSAMSRALIDWMGGAERVRGALWLPALAMIALAALSGLAIHLKTRLRHRRRRARGAPHARPHVRPRAAPPVQHARRIPSGDLVQRCTSDIETLRMFLANQAPEIGRSVLMLLIPLPVTLSRSTGAWRSRRSSAFPPCSGSPPSLPAHGPELRHQGGRGAHDRKRAGKSRRGSAPCAHSGAPISRTIASGAAPLHSDDADRRSSATTRTSGRQSDFLCFLQLVIVVSLGAMFVSRGSMSAGSVLLLPHRRRHVHLARAHARPHGGRKSGKALAAVVRLDEVLAKPEERDLDPARGADALAAAT
jgi:ATP-binding cassette subfamily B protein